MSKRNYIATAKKSADIQINELKKAGEFFAKVGLPVNLAQLGIDKSDLSSLNRVMESAQKASTMQNEPMLLDTSSLVDAALEADKIGSKLLETIGESAYLKIH